MGREGKGNEGRGMRQKRTKIMGKTRGTEDVYCLMGP